MEQAIRRYFNGVGEIPLQKIRGVEAFQNALYEEGYDTIIDEDRGVIYIRPVFYGNYLKLGTSDGLREVKSSDGWLIQPTPFDELIKSPYVKSSKEIEKGDFEDDTSYILYKVTLSDDSVIKVAVED